MLDVIDLMLGSPTWLSPVGKNVRPRAAATLANMVVVLGSSLGKEDVRGFRYRRVTCSESRGEVLRRDCERVIETGTFL